MPKFKRSLLSRKELAALTGLSVAFFEKHNGDGVAPPSIKLGGRVFYDEIDVQDWIQSRRQSGGGSINV